jgi:putative ABC transport system permease protein
MPYLADLSTDAGILAYLAFITIGTGVAFGLIPALYASRPRFAALMSGDTRSTAGTGRAQLRAGLVTLEIAMTVVLLIGAGLLMRSLTRLLHADAGFDASRTLVMRIALPGEQYSGLAQQQFFEHVLQEVRAVPGVQTVGAVDNLPLNGGGTNTFHVDGQPEPDPARRPEAVMRAVAGDYFRTLGIKLLDGRVFDNRDDSTAVRAIVISEAVARRYITSTRAVGAQIRFYAWANQPWTVVGVVGDVKTVRLDEDAPPTIYYSHLQGPANRMSLAIRSAVEPSALIATVRRAVSAVDPTLPIYGIRTMQEQVTASPAVYARRYPLVLLGAFAAASLILAIVGIAGVISYSVAQRTREIGVRVALGAERRTIVAMVLKQGGTLAIPGVVLGILIAFVAARWLGSVLYGVSAGDPLTYAGIAALIIFVALAASYVPARRAAGLDPAQVLRAD